MRSLNGRVAKLEEATTTGPSNVEIRRRWRDVFRRVANAIDEGVIQERTGKEREWFAPVHTPSGPAWHDLHLAERFIIEAAVATGWRSQCAPNEQQWQLYRANSLAELRWWCQWVEAWATAIEG